jgi:hypothetical protein
LGGVISGPVEVMALDGTVKYHNVYKQPGETGRRLLKGVSIAATQVAGAASRRLQHFKVEK